MAANSIFREYIGGKPYPDDLKDFPDIINRKLDEFHFILASAVEEYDNNGKGTGIFRQNWNENYFGAEHIKELKRKYRYENVKVKVMISIGGRGNAFDPAEKEVWPDRARDSLEKIIQHYQRLDAIIDGIDINYEVVKTKETDFAHCIGSVIDALKNKDKVINEVSIAPSKNTQSHYLKLYRAHQKDVRLVDYQFYDQSVPSAADFVALFRQLSDEYQENILLAGFSTDLDLDSGKLSREVFIEAATDLINTGSLRGIFVWDANDSAAADDPFFFEVKAQKLLTGSGFK
ncbi:chitinase 2-like [Abrus precatorius]|uniref:Chitinase 2-like n=1 Tax=Abrus precatorius TaxID=3816 RepID=A0A8B8KW60_ABRPR|nr:chitinase 2-like [Abrus precatorius]